MLAKSKLSKFLLVFLLVLCSSCRIHRSYDKRTQAFDTQVICPNGLKVLVVFANAKDIKKAMQKAVFDKKRAGSNENYTVIRLPGDRSFKFEKLSPNDALQCGFIEFPTKPSSKDFRNYLPD